MQLTTINISYEAEDRIWAAQFKSLLLDNIEHHGQRMFIEPVNEKLVDGSPSKIVKVNLEFQVESEYLQDFLQQIDSIRFMRANIKTDVYEHIYGGSTVTVFPTDGSHVESSAIAFFLHEHSQELERKLKNSVLDNLRLASRINELEAITNDLIEKYAGIQVYLHQVAKIPELKQLVVELAEETNNAELLEIYDFHRIQ